ncbi:MAG: hypothetical protein ACRDO2_13130 [Nocardioidaceae bacterium]
MPPIANGRAVVVALLALTFGRGPMSLMAFALKAEDERDEV